ncbi:GTPase IMAP family member 9-like [Mytilus californianus]|uniref:GTPase IMAP family member 9-like n=1 Tax=Mytilus californianus TaxID=6549 RepID=UPI0022466A5E|nr:GTPase IMAP family member 9-like [Mytilus californianus]
MYEPEENRALYKGLPLRPPLPTPDETRTRKEEDAVKMATLYGGREKNEIRLVMVGKTGSGKSATGNTIMEKANYFESTISAGSVTRYCERAECKQAERKVIVVDTPGLFDTNIPSDEVSEEITRCINMSIPGPHAFLLVMPITRFTSEEFDSFNRLFELFGDGMGRFACIVFTRLDDLERGKKSIEKYIETAPQLKNFIQRCKGRYIAFDNTAPEKKKKVQVKHFIELVDKIIKENGGNYYTNELYREAEATLQRKVKELEEEKAQQKRKEIELIQSKFKHEIDSMREENKKLSEQVSSNKEHQKQVQRERENADQQILKMKEKIK